ncbi:MAG: malate:quinone oxidoreductase [Microbacterium sp.]
MLGLLEDCFPDRIAGWRPKIAELIPTYGRTLNKDAAKAHDVLARTAAELHINA